MQKNRLCKQALKILLKRPIKPVLYLKPNPLSTHFFYTPYCPHESRNEHSYCRKSYPCHYHQNRFKKQENKTIDISQYSAHGEQGGGSTEELINRREGTRGGKQRPPLSTVHLIFPRETWRAVLFPNLSPFIIEACLWYRKFVNAQGLEKRRGERWELESNARDSDPRR